MVEMEAFDPHMLVFIDETGCERCNSICRYGLVSYPDPSLHTPTRKDPGIMHIRRVAEECMMHVVSFNN